MTPVAWLPSFPVADVVLAAGLVLADRLADVQAAAPEVTGAITMALDPGKAIIGAGLAVGAGVVAGLRYLASRTIGHLDLITEKVGNTEKHMQKMSHELFGPDGNNGMRSDVKRMSRMLDSHDVVLIELAIKNNIDIPERVQ